MRHARTFTRGRFLVPTAVVVLLWTAAAGLAQPPARLLRAWNAEAISWWMVVVPALGWLAGLTLVLARTMPQPRYRTALLRAGALELVLLLAGVALLAGIDTQHRAAGRNRGPDVLPIPRISLPALPMIDPRVVFGLFVLGVAAGFVLLLWSLLEVRDRLLRPRGALVRDARYGRGRSRSAEHDLTLDAFTRARAALVSDENVRRAVIAAYASLESSVIKRGSDRSRAQTAAEFLHAAIDSGTVDRRREAEELLELFHRARFSHLPMGAEDREHALSCLTALQHDVAGRTDQRP